jgi:hypothetical protein
MAIFKVLVTLVKALVIPRAALTADDVARRCAKTPMARSLSFERLTAIPWKIAARFRRIDGLSPA